MCSVTLGSVTLCHSAFFFFKLYGVVQIVIVLILLVICLMDMYGYMHTDINDIHIMDYNIQLTLRCQFFSTWSTNSAQLWSKLQPVLWKISTKLF